MTAGDRDITLFKSLAATTFLLGFLFHVTGLVMGLVVSVPIHLTTLWTRSTDYLLIAPRWYSMIEVPMFRALTYMATRLQFAPAPDASAPRRGHLDVLTGPR